MGCDIHGWVEIVKYPDSSPGWWSPVLKIDSLVGRNYSMFALLFNQRNYDNFKPLTDGERGIPEYDKWTSEDDGNETLKDIKEWGVDGHSHTWLLYDELKHIDWDQKVTSCYIHEYDSKGEYIGGFISSSILTDEEEKKIRDGGTVTKYDNGFKNQEITYKLGTSTPDKKHIGEEWQALFDIMKRLADSVGEKNVRMVVWFDN